ncbi:MAG: GldG family protein, partial [Dehalococcoidia bacterium]
MSRTPRGEEQPLSGILAEHLRRLYDVVGGLSTVLGAAGLLAVALGGLIFLLQEELRAYSYVLLALGGVLLLASLAISYRAVGATLAARQGRYGINTITMVLAFVGIVALGNFLAFSNTLRADLTATKQFSLAPQTLDILRDLPEPVQATAFFVPGRADQRLLRQQVEDLLSEFTRRSDRFSYRSIDPDVDPVTAQRYSVIQYPTVVFEGTNSGRIHLVANPPMQEQDFLTALLISTGVEQKTVYLLTGHGERNANDVDQGTQGFGYAVGGLQGDNYRVTTLNLRQAGEIPENAAAIIVAGPRRDMVEWEVEGEVKREAELLHQYLRNGGRMVFLLDPGTPQSFRDLLEPWGIRAIDGTLMDIGSSVAGEPQTPLITRDRYNTDVPILGDLDDTFFPASVALEPALEPDEDQLPETISFIALTQTTGASWLTQEPERTQFDPTRDLLGLFSNVVLVNAVAPRGEEPLRDSEGNFLRASLVVFGDSDFATNKYFFAFSNGDFLLNAVNWLTGDVALISVRPKPQVFRELVLTRNELSFIRYSSWFLV